MHRKMFEWGEWPAVAGVVYMDVPVDIAQGRVAKRGRTAESGIPCDYQYRLHCKHEVLP